MAVHDFYTTAGGGRRATSVGGVLTGLGADMIIIDDALKPEDALSETKRKSVNDWYDSTLLSRLNDKNTGCIVIIMQRLHQDDLVGYVSSRELWAGVSFPAIAEEDERFVSDTPFGRRTFERKMGEALHPQRESLTILAGMRERIGEFNFASQYQQRPIPLGGAIVKTNWLQYYAPGELPEDFDAIVQSWDTANKSTELSDFSVCTTWGKLRRNIYLLHVYRARLNYPDLKRKVKELAEYHRATTILIEDKASGTQLVQALQAEHLCGVVPYAPPPGNDKIMRLHAQTPWFENGRVFLPQNASWLGDYVLELTGFPGSKYDDQVDSTSQALDHMKAPSMVEIWERLGEMGNQLPF